MTRETQEYIPAGNQKKRELLEYLTQQIGNNRDILFANYRGLSVESMSLLRKRVEHHDAMVCVMKNRLMLKALVSSDRTDAELADVLKGPTAVVFAKESGMEVLRDIVAFNAEESDIPCSLKGAFIENMFYTEANISKIKDLPSKQVLLSQLMSTMTAPIRSLAQLMQELVAAPVRLLSKVGQNKKK